jgi:hypothetical protein
MRERRIGPCQSLLEHFSVPKGREEICNCEKRFLAFVCSNLTKEISPSGVEQSTISLCPLVVVICGWLQQAFLQSFVVLTATNVHCAENILHPGVKFVSLGRAVWRQFSHSEEASRLSISGRFHFGATLIYEAFWYGNIENKVLCFGI